MRALARAGRLSANELAETIGASRQYASHVMASLVAAGWVTSTRGPGGGYELNGDASVVSVLEVINAMERPLDVEACVLRPQPCLSDDRCALHDAWSQARTALLNELSGRRVLDHMEAES